jgi:hypothetical protein
MSEHFEFFSQLEFLLMDYNWYKINDGDLVGGSLEGRRVGEE